MTEAICKKCSHYDKCVRQYYPNCPAYDPQDTEQTNEKWFDGLSTEEKAKVFANATYSTAETPLTILWGGKEAEQKKWELWLKQPHTIKE